MAIRPCPRSVAMRRKVRSRGGAVGDVGAIRAIVPCDAGASPSAGLELLESRLRPSNPRPRIRQGGSDGLRERGPFVDRVDLQLDAERR